MRRERPARIAFAGTPDFAVPALEAAARLGTVDLVLTQPDRPAGRGRKLTPPPVKHSAVELGLRVEQPESLTDVSAAGWHALTERPDVLVVVAYGLLLPAWVLEWPRVGCVNVHASLLPRWRGAAPIQHAILAGDETTGVSLMRMERGLDTGPVYASRTTPIGEHETAAELHDRLAGLGARLLADVLPEILAGRCEPVPQDASRATYAPKIRKGDARLDWRQPAVVLARRVRAFDPWPVAFAMLPDGTAIRILGAVAVATDAVEGARPGDVVAASRGGIDVQTGRGVLRLTRVQPPSSRVMDAAAYLAAHSVDGVAFL